MPRWVNILVQILSMLVQIANPMLAVLAKEYSPTVMVVIASCIAFIQGSVAIISHAYNPDGSRAYTPYIPPPDPTPATTMVPVPIERAQQQPAEAPVSFENHPPPGTKVTETKTTETK